MHDSTPKIVRESIRPRVGHALRYAFRPALLLFCLLAILPGGPPELRAKDVRPGSPQTSAPRPPGDLYALAVGISQYREPRIRKLDFAANDATAFGDMLKKEEHLFGKKHVKILINEKATQRAINKFLTHDLRRAGKNDTIILFFSGHGQYDPRRISDFYFAPYDVEPGYLAATGVKMSGLDFLRSLETERVLVIADACHSGGFSEWTGSAKGLPPNIEVFMRDFKHTTGRVILTSAGPNEKSYEMKEIDGQPRLRNGVFTHFLLQGLRGKADANRDGSVTVNEAYQYAYDMTREATNGLQHPQFEGRHSGAFPLAFTGSVIPSWKLKRSLLNAVASGNLTRVKELRAELLDITTARDDHNRTSLILAAEMGHPPVVKLILAQKPDLEAKDDSGNTALIAASAMGHEEIARLLLDRGANPNAKNKEEESALTAAARNGRRDVVKLLLERRANVHAMNARGSTALLLASYKGHAEIVRMLLDAGANATAKDFKGRTALSHASRYGHSDVVRILMSRIPAGKDLTMKVDLFRSVLVGDSRSVKRALDSGAGIDTRTPYKDTPLTLAAGLGHTKILKLLLAKGADVNARIGYNSTALSWAAHNGKADAVQALLDKGADVNARDNGGSTPLTYAAQNGYRSIVERLCKQGADADNRSKSGNTPLIQASAKGHLEIVRLLLAKGADPAARGRSGNTALIRAAQNGHAATVKLLLEKGARIEARNDQQETALTLASARGHGKTVKLLLEHGASVRARNRKGATALFRAARRGHAEIVAMLLEKGADPLAANKEGILPASVASDGGHPRVARLLRSTLPGKK
jgi:ankyrin repeat protein